MVQRTSWRSSKSAMKVAVLCESPPDWAAIRILIDGILGKQTEEVPSLPRIETRPGGWPSVRTLLPVAIRYLYFYTDVNALVVVADSDDSPIHQAAHDEAGREDPRCRLCQLRRIIKETVVSPVRGRGNLKSAVGVAVPAIEAWYLCGVDQHVNESTWARKIQHSEKITYTRNELKKRLYGTEHPALETMKHHAIEAATRLVDDLSKLEQLFPSGFGPLVEDIRNW